MCKRRGISDRHMSNLSFKIVALMHDNRLLPYFRNPYKRLQAAGLKPDQTVLEVGCGLGYFTIPAAKLVETQGFVYTVDVHPLAVARVKEKIEAEGVKNVKPMLANAANTGLPGQSIDLAFIFGLQYIADGLEAVLTELRRIIKTGGVLSVEKTRGSAEKLIADVERAGFSFMENKRRIFVFTKRNINL